MSSEEAINLRKLCGNFSGATGDQSYSEAITSSNMVVYECQPWKQDLVAGMKSIANKVDPTGELSKAIHLLAFASKDDEYIELANLIKREDIQIGFALYQKEILATKDLSETFGAAVEKMVNQVQGEKKTEVEGSKQEKSKKSSFISSLMQRAKSSDPKKIDSDSAEVKSSRKPKTPDLKNDVGVETSQQEKSKRSPKILSWMKREKTSDPQKDIGDSKSQKDQKFKM